MLKCMYAWRACSRTSSLVCKLWKNVEVLFFGGKKDEMKLKDSSSKIS
jgi:hypothetical protein